MEQKLAKYEEEMSLRDEIGEVEEQVKGYNRLEMLKEKKQKLMEKQKMQVENKKKEESESDEESEEDEGDVMEDLLNWRTKGVKKKQIFFA